MPDACQTAVVSPLAEERKDLSVPVSDLDDFLAAKIVFLDQSFRQLLRRGLKMRREMQGRFILC
jgi:hypothetical protein